MSRHISFCYNCCPHANIPPQTTTEIAKGIFELCQGSNRIRMSCHYSCFLDTTFFRAFPWKVDQSAPLRWHFLNDLIYYLFFKQKFYLPFYLTQSSPTAMNIVATKKKSSQGCPVIQQTFLWVPNCPIELLTTIEEYLYEVLHSVWKYLSGILTSIPELWLVKK